MGFESVDESNDEFASVAIQIVDIGEPDTSHNFGAVLDDPFGHDHVFLFVWKTVLVVDGLYDVVMDSVFDFIKIVADFPELHRLKNVFYVSLLVLLHT